MKKCCNGISQALVALTVLAIVQFAGGLYLAFEGREALQSIRGAEQRQSAIFSQLAAFSQVQRAAGYTRFIHNFKDGILQLRVDKLRESISDLHSVHAALEQLFFLNPGLRQDIDSLDVTLDRHLANAELAIKLIGEGLSPAEIDRRLQADDVEGAAALGRLFSAIDQQRQTLDGRFRRLMADWSMNANFAYLEAAAISVAAVLLILLQMTMRRRFRDLRRAQDTLVRIETALGPDDGTMVAADLSVNLEKRIGKLTTHIEQQARDLRQHAENLEARETELRAAVRQTHAAAAAKAQFLGNMSHEMRTPLNGIIGFAEIMLMRADDLGDKVRTYVENIQASGYRLLHLVEGLLTLADGAGMAMLNPETVHLKPFLEQLCGRYRASAAVKGIDFRLELPARSATILVDRNALRFALRPVIDNAVKFAECGDQVTVSAQLEDALTVTVRDTGCGMSSEEVAKAANAFYQCRADALVRDHEGAGIGLTVAHTSIEALGGTLRIDSDPGQGTTITVEIPLGASDQGVMLVATAVA